MSRKRHTVNISLYGKIYIIMALWYGLPFSVNQKLKRKIYRLGKGHEIIPTLQLAMSSSKKNKWKRNQDMNREERF